MHTSPSSSPRGVFGRVGGRGHGVLFGQTDSNGQCRAGRWCPEPTLSLLSGPGHQQTDPAQSVEGGGDGGWRVRSGPGEQQGAIRPTHSVWGSAWPGPGPYLQDVSRKEMFTSQWVWTLQGEKQRVRLASRVWYLNRRACGWHGPPPPRALAPRELGCLGLSLLPSGTSSSSRGCRQHRTMRQEPTPGLTGQRNREDSLEAATALLLGAANPEEWPHWAPGAGRSLSRPSATD